MSADGKVTMSHERNGKVADAALSAMLAMADGALLARGSCDHDDGSVSRVGEFNCRGVPTRVTIKVESFRD